MQIEARKGLLRAQVSARPGGCDLPAEPHHPPRDHQRCLAGLPALQGRPDLFRRQERWLPAVWSRRTGAHRGAVHLGPVTGSATPLGHALRDGSVQPGSAAEGEPRRARRGSARSCPRGREPGGTPPGSRPGAREQERGAANVCAQTSWGGVEGDQRPRSEGTGRTRSARAERQAADRDQIDAMISLKVALGRIAASVFASSGM